jgi:phosphoribosylformylglycinamidine synthase
MKLNTIEVADKPIEGTSTVSLLEEALRDIGIEEARAFSTAMYTIAGELNDEDLGKIPELVHHDITQTATVNKPLENGHDWDFAIRVDYKPGVTDNAARILKADTGRKKIEGEVYTSLIHYVKGKFDPNIKEMLERVTSNPKIHDITILTKKEFAEKGGFEAKIHPVNLGQRDNYFWLDLGSMDEQELIRTSQKGTLNLKLVKEGMTEEEIDGLRGGTLSLVNKNYGLDYMNAIIAYANSELNTETGRKAGTLTDTELEMIAQMWSEHCRHGMYSAAIAENKKGIFAEYIKKPTLKVLEEKPHLGKSIFKDNSGVFVFNEKWLIGVKNETHNSPSALDPYGGAITGIVGVNRDPAGTGLGAEVIGNFQFYRFGHQNDRRRYFKTKKADGTLEELLLNPKQIAAGVWSGVQEGGNQMGIPVNIGDAVYHDNYNGKPIVGVGSIGRLPHTINGKPSYEKHIDSGDLVYICGGRAGKDGIHGATFSSEELSANSPATAVQIGDAYTQRKLFEALLEARDRGIIKFVTDLGAGGTCCAVMEMAEETGGIEIDMDKLLIKYQGMTATELLLNESQERMAVAVDPKRAQEFEEILKKHESEYSIIGSFNNNGRAVVYCKGDRVVDLSMNFLHKGMPQRKLNPKEYKIGAAEAKLEEEELSEAIRKGAAEAGSGEKFLQQEFEDMLRRPNLGSQAGYCDRMDSTVKGLQVQHCIQGKGRVSTKAACTLVDTECGEGLIQAYGHAERQTYIDAERHGKNAFLRAIGNNIAMSGRLDYMVATDQALWQSSDEGEYQQMLIEANRGMAQVTTGCKIPVISGKDSMYNQATIYAEDGSKVKRGVFPEINMITFSKIDDVNDVVTIDAKQEGDLVYIVGATTKDDMGGSEYVNKYSEKAGKQYKTGNVSNEDITDVFDTFQKMNDSQKEKLAQSAAYIEAGGLATALRNTAMAGELGIEFDSRKVKMENSMLLNDMLYSETEGRFLVTINPKDRQRFEDIFKGKHNCIGEVKGKNLMMKGQEGELISKPVDEMLKTYHRRAA